MNNTQIMKQAIDLLEQISEDPDYFAQEIGPIDGALVVQTLSALSQQSATMQTEAELLRLCDTMHKLVEELPALRELLLTRQSNVIETQEYRSVTIHDITTIQKQAHQRFLAMIHQRLDKPCQQLNDALPKLNKIQQQEFSHRLPRFFEKLGIKFDGPKVAPLAV